MRIHRSCYRRRPPKSSLNQDQEPEQSSQSISPVDSILSLHRTVGNHAVQRLVQSGGLQAKLNVGAPNDVYEQEADHVASQVMHMSNPAIQQKPAISSLNNGGPLQRMCPECEKEMQRKPIEENKDDLQLQAVKDDEKKDLQMQSIEEDEKNLQMQSMDDEKDLQMQSIEDDKEAVVQSKKSTAGGLEVTSDIEARIQSQRGSGHALRESARSFFEPRFGQSFGDVRIHTDARANTLNRALNARAFTTGQDIFFRQGEYNPGSSSGRELLAHELTHVVQQNSPKALLSSQAQPLQRRVGDGHDLTNPRFSGETRLEATYDKEQLIAVGSYGDHVKRIQEALLDLGYALPKHGADCEYGTETQLAVYQFQSDHGLVKDYTVGSETMGRLDVVAPQKLPGPVTCSFRPAPGPPPEGMTCEEGYVYDPAVKDCVPEMTCEEGYVYDPTVRDCVPAMTCEEDHVYDPVLRDCVPKNPQPQPAGPCCDFAEFTRLTDICFATAKYEAIMCHTPFVKPSLNPWSNAGKMVRYYVCLGNMRDKMTACVEQAKRDTNCPDEPNRPPKC